MSDVFGVNSTRAYTGDPQDKAPVEFGGGRIRAVMDEYEAEALASGSAIRMGEVPRGAVIYDGVLAHEAMGADVTLAVRLVPADGVGDPIVLAAAAAAASAGTIDIDDIDAALQVEVPKKHFVEVLTGGAAATGTMKLRLQYAPRA